MLRRFAGMSELKSLYAWNWIAGGHSNRPMRPSEARVTVTGTQRYLPWARADMGMARPMLPWEHRTGNDWRGLRAS